MKIALYGYGKMGKAIEEVAVARGHSIALRVDHDNAGAAPDGCDVAIEFSTPATALANMRLCLAHRVPVVVGTTGWYEHLGEIEAKVRETQGSLLWASNFSIGVNLFFRLNRFLSGLMDGQAAYNVRIDETHHSHKLDAPSGTAVTLARDLERLGKRYSAWKLVDDGNDAKPGEIPVHSKRIGEVPGTHTITWESAEDRIVITHEAFGRKGFATGAVAAAEWLHGRTGFFTMDDLLGNSH
jgi:4-hydroxy-tetrahydrodipicolinate reductase